MTLEQFRELLGETGTKMTELEILNLMSVFDHLSDYWLDKQEIMIFGKPIKTLLDQ